MQIAERESGSVTVLDLSGRITMGEDGNLLKDKLQSLLHQGKKNILFNLGQVSYVDSAGLGAIVQMHRDRDEKRFAEFDLQSAENGFHRIRCTPRLVAGQ